MKNSPSSRGEFCCEVCEKKFGLKHNLKAHMRTHTNERPYHCSCGARYRWKSSLRKHIDAADARLTRNQPTGESIGDVFIPEHYPFQTWSLTKMRVASGECPIQAHCLDCESREDAGFESVHQSMSISQPQVSSSKHREGRLERTISGNGDDASWNENSWIWEAEWLDSSIFDSLETEFNSLPEIIQPNIPPT
uniref:C2H2-type domain-containing protein n=1 Tax=Compsopogon caeruleus TaxID=31354 RepID=A0A7S1TGA5_9RHOD|mmetsp:Transcript_4927/g.9936  ORF Transcript_4927/g.9936 Transcript_4927/m.9936 type:complete len:193 (+) Transcript_4927:717-1295(+)|eukprot:CAMPEP_0184690614 /NCGR_PEP_ID=MMETSP0312-20130426/31328_1 /TAXON_ID=31354 /ORGANISM="Compsopogon coeruleus, Strain SAG 36.94" /LENGTH=192 /DNA_ID=CAMNT_0027148135 /DNA_START=641 /DNA_END=1219 /DNA_ORIENTATION=+